MKFKRLETRRVLAIINDCEAEVVRQMEEKKLLLDAMRKEEVVWQDLAYLQTLPLLMAAGTIGAGHDSANQNNAPKSCYFCKGVEKEIIFFFLSLPSRPVSIICISFIIITYIIVTRSNK